MLRQFCRCSTGNDLPNTEKTGYSVNLPPSGPVEKHILARTILKAYAIPLDMVDWNNSGIGKDQYIQAVTTVLCPQRHEAGALTPAQVKLCYSDSSSKPPGGIVALSSDGDKQLMLVQDLEFALRGAAGADRSQFKLSLAKGTLMFTRKPTSDLAKERKVIEHGKDAPLASQVFSDDHFEIKCEAKSKPGIAQGTPPVKGLAAPMQAPADQAAASEIFDRFRVRGKPEDLSIARGDDAFAGVSTASLAIVNDIAAQKNTFDAHVALGYAIPVWEANGTLLESIPFIQYDRSYVDGGKAPPNSSSVNNLALGAQERLTFPISGVYSTFFSSLLTSPAFDLMQNSSKFVLPMSRIH